MNQQESLRYSRHFLLPEVGEAGQEKLKDASVLLVGMGGLGSPLALYLAAAGVGRLGLLDFDTIDLSNLQRQVLYSTQDIGQSKAKTAAEKLRALNPHIEVIVHEEKLTAQNAEQLFRQYQIVADGADNFTARYLCNDAAVLTGRPLVSASILGFEGQLAVFNYKGGPCYRCLYPEAPPAGAVPSCAENGVLGALPGVMGTMQALEVLKLILGIGEPLSGQLLYFHALAMDFQKMQTSKNESCAVCGREPTIRSVQEITQHCVLVPEISPEGLRDKMAARECFVLVDVRESHEVAVDKIPDSLHIPLGRLEERLGEISRALPVIVYCQMGGRSARAVEILKGHGIAASNLTGGMNRWNQPK